MARSRISPSSTRCAAGGWPSQPRWGLVGLLALSLLWLFAQGVGVWGNNIPVTWALDIVSYDWWIGVASGGLFVSAAFMLVDAQWRSAVNRITETLSLVAAAAAAVYPIIHLGRPWFFYWNLPYPNTFDLWPQFRSPLFWDAVDIIAFLGTAIVFWYVGMVPDLATLRDRAVGAHQTDKRARGRRAPACPALRHHRTRLARIGHALAAAGCRPIASSRFSA